MTTINTPLAKVIGTQNERELEQIRPLVAEINAKEAQTAPLSDESLCGRTAEFRQRVANGETTGLPVRFRV